MGAELTRIVSEVTFTGQAAGDDDKERQRLIYAYGQYRNLNSNIFNELNALVEKDGNEIGEFVVKHNLDWPENENGLIGADGLFN